MPHHQLTPEPNKGLARRMRREMTQAELRLWLRLRNRALAGFRFRRQAPMARSSSISSAPKENWWSKWMASITVFDAEVARDATRQHWIEAQGHHVLRVSNHDVMTNPMGYALRSSTVVDARSDLTPPQNPPLADFDPPARGGFWRLW